MHSAKHILILSLLGFVCVAVPLHFWLSDRHAVMRGLFSFQAPIAAWSSRCSEGAPEWLSDMADQGVFRLKALSTQVTLLNNAGQVSHCETGWTSTMLLSNRVNRNTSFRYGSLTKPITAAKILSLAEEGKLALDSTLGDLFSSSEGQGEIRDVTVSDLLRHRSGIRESIFVRKSKPACPYRLTDLIASGSAEGRGEFRYSNFGYCILGEIIKEVTGLTYREAMESSYNLSTRQISYAEYEEAYSEVERDFRFNDFYGRNLKGRFDYKAISSTAGMSGSASAYALLLGDLIKDNPAGLFEDSDCDYELFKQCYGYAFYGYAPIAGKVYQIKEGYLPGAAGVVVINEDREVFVWLGNSDTENAADGENMKIFLTELAKNGF